MVEIGPMIAWFIGAMFAWALLGRLWFSFKWSVLGWRPRILDAALVTYTVDECATSAVESMCLLAEERHDYVPTEEEKQEQIVQMKDAFRQVIDRYIENFSRSR